MKRHAPALLALLIALSGCGGSGDSTSSGSESAPETNMPPVCDGPDCSGEPDQPESNGPEGATETNFVPVVCESDEDCPEGVACIYPNGETMVGNCDVQETEESGA